MARPLDINLLLGKLKDKRSNDGKVEKLIKPKFLSKEQRVTLSKELAAGTKHNNIPVILQSKKNTNFSTRTGEDYDDKNNYKVREELGTNSEQHRQASKKSKFQFKWNDGDDTLSNYNPITSISVGDLIKSNQQQKHDEFEKAYLGKHWSEKTLNEMNDRDWRTMKADFHITTKGSSSVMPLRNWNELKIIPDELLRIITDDLHFADPTPIQRVTIPNAIKKKDFLGVSATGSGKTLAFLLPIFINLFQNGVRPRSIKILEGPKALILAPTRELAQQIENEAQKIIKCWKNQDCTVASIVGGHSIEEITANVSSGCDILVATPGRLIDCLENNILPITNLQTLVLDEADEMVDFGFEDQLTSILNKIEVETISSSSKRQVMMFTATMVPSIERIVNGYLRNPVYVTVDSGNNNQPEIKQTVVYSSTDDQRFKKMIEVIGYYNGPIIVFINYKRTADWLAQKFQHETHYKVTTLHGSKNQEQREHSLNLLRTGKVQVLIATNVAARGLDIPNVELVINFHMAKMFEDYIHRIGRTGRAGKSGSAFTFIGDDEEKNIVQELYKYVMDNNPTKHNDFDKTIKIKYEIGNEKMDQIIH